MHEQRNNNNWYQPTNVAAAKQQADLDLKQVKQKYSNEKKKWWILNTKLPSHGPIKNFF